MFTATWNFSKKARVEYICIFFNFTSRLGKQKIVIGTCIVLQKYFIHYFSSKFSTWTMYNILQKIEKNPFFKDFWLRQITKFRLKQLNYSSLFSFHKISWKYENLVFTTWHLKSEGVQVSKTLEKFWWKVCIYTLERRALVRQLNQKILKFSLLDFWILSRFVLHFTVYEKFHRDSIHFFVFFLYFWSEKSSKKKNLIILFL